MDDPRLRTARDIGVKVPAELQNWMGVQFSDSFDDEFHAEAMHMEILNRFGITSSRLYRDETNRYLLVNHDNQHAVSHLSEMLDMLEQGEHIAEDEYWEKLDEAKFDAWREMPTAERIELLKHEECDLALAFSDAPPEGLEEHLEHYVRGF